MRQTLSQIKSYQHQQIDVPMLAHELRQALVDLGPDRILLPRDRSTWTASASVTGKAVAAFSSFSRGSHPGSHAGGRPRISVGAASPPTGPADASAGDAVADSDEGGGAGLRTTPTFSAPVSFVASPLQHSARKVQPTQRQGGHGEANQEQVQGQEPPPPPTDTTPTLERSASPEIVQMQQQVRCR